MAKLIGLPKLSPTMDEGTLVRWTKAEGDAVDIDDLLAEVETDKATMEFRSFDKGTLLKILADEGATLAPDAPVAIIGAKGDDIDALVAKAKGGSAPAPDSEKGTEKSNGASEGKAKSEPAAAKGGGEPAKDKQEATSDEDDSAEDSRVLASPLVRKLARERGLDLRSVDGSGPGGRVIKRDLDGQAEGASDGAAKQGESSSSSAGKASTSQGASATSSAGVDASGLALPRVEKASQMRKVIARRLTESKQQVPHFYLSVDIDAEPLVRFREQLNAEASKAGGKVSFNDLVVKAAAIALRRMPKVNASFAGDELHFHQRIDISVAVAVPDGLVTPVVRDADRLGTLDISKKIKELAEKARDKKLKPEEMQNGTFSVSNLGMYGIQNFQAVINPPEGGILAVGALRDEAVIKDGRVVPGKRMGLTLSCDHRIVDGALAAEWLSVLRGLLEAPLTMLL